MRTYETALEATSEMIRTFKEMGIKLPNSSSELLWQTFSIKDRDIGDIAKINNKLNSRNSEAYLINFVDDLIKKNIERNELLERLSSENLDGYNTVSLINFDDKALSYEFLFRKQNKEVQVFFTSQRFYFGGFNLLLLMLSRLINLYFGSRSSQDIRFKGMYFNFSVLLFYLEKSNYVF